MGPNCHNVSHTRKIQTTEMNLRKMTRALNSGKYGFRRLFWWPFSVTYVQVTGQLRNFTNYRVHSVKYNRRLSHSIILRPCNLKEAVQNRATCLHIFCACGDQSLKIIIIGMEALGAVLGIATAAKEIIELAIKIKQSIDQVCGKYIAPSIYKRMTLSLVFRSAITKRIMLVFSILQRRPSIDCARLHGFSQNKTLCTIPGKPQSCYRSTSLPILEVLRITHC
jgi:hypothetical protein